MNVFQKTKPNAEVITSVLKELIHHHGRHAIERCINNPLDVKSDPDRHINNLILTYSYSEVMEIFLCLTNKIKDNSA